MTKNKSIIQLFLINGGQTDYLTLISSYQEIIIYSNYIIYSKIYYYVINYTLKLSR